MELIDSLAGPAFDMVRAGRVDFALTAANPAYADLDYTPLVSDRFVLLMQRTHTLARGRGAMPGPRWPSCTTSPCLRAPACGSTRKRPC